MAEIETTETSFRRETDRMGEVDVPSSVLWGAQTQRSPEHFSIGHDLIPREMITAYATLKKAAAVANHAGGRLDNRRYQLIVQVCDEILAGQHHEMFPLHVIPLPGYIRELQKVRSSRDADTSENMLGRNAPPR